MLWVRSKCRDCGQWNGYKADVELNGSTFPLKTETCKKCESVIAGPLKKDMKAQSTGFLGMSRSEIQVARFLDTLKLPWLYEFPIFVFDEKNRPRVWTPDFFIPRLGVYLEVCGSEGFDYSYREKIYSANNVNVIFIHFYKHKETWKKYLIVRIKEIENQRHVDATRLIESFPYIE